MAQTAELAGDGPPRRVLAPSSGPYEHLTDLLLRHDALLRRQIARSQVRKPADILGFAAISEDEVQRLLDEPPPFAGSAADVRMADQTVRELQLLIDAIGLYCESIGEQLSARALLDTYTAPLAPGTYTVSATSVIDGNKKGSCIITVPAVTIALTTAPAATVFRGTTHIVGATVGNAVNTAINWSTSGGSVSPGRGPSTTFTAPLAPGMYTVTATSATDSLKFVNCQITVPPVTISIVPDQSSVTAGHQTTVRATITGTSDNRATWQSQSSAASITPGPSNTATWSAPGVGGVFQVKAIPVSDTNQFALTTISVPNVKTGIEGGGKFAAIPIQTESILTPKGPVSEPVSKPVAAPDEQTDTGKARSFVRPKKRPSTKLPPESTDG